MANKFITFEGIDGAGKSSHIEPLADRLRSLGHTVVVTREPGGTGLGEKLRELALHHPCETLTETLLMFASRNEHIAQVITPALQRGETVICDRFNDSTFAYQGLGRGVDWQQLKALELLAGNLRPDLTLLFDLPIDVARVRVNGRREPDRFELETVDFFERVRAGYLRRLDEDSSRFRVIDATCDFMAVREEVLKTALALAL